MDEQSSVRRKIQAGGNNTNGGAETFKDEIS